MRILLVGEGKHELGKKGHRGRSGRGFEKRAIRWMRHAEKEQFDAIVLLVDEDGCPERVREIRAAQESTVVPTPRALGVAIRTFDAWMLADEPAMTSVLGFPIDREKEIETLPDPKATCRELLKRSEQSMSQTEMYSGIARASDLSTIEKRCLRGFGTFAQRVRVLKSA